MFRKGVITLSELSYLLTNYSFEQLIFLIVVVLLVCKVFIEIGNYFYGKAKGYFGVKSTKEKWQNDTTETLNKISCKMDNFEVSAAERMVRLEKIEEKVDTLEEYNRITHEQQKALNNQMKLVQERLQENTRSFLIDAHHRFCYDVKGIDDQSLQSMERRYLYYKTAGGNSFIDDLMKEVRALPRINYATIQNGSYPDGGREING